MMLFKSLSGQGLQQKHTSNGHVNITQPWGKWIMSLSKCCNLDIPYHGNLVIAFMQIQKVASYSIQCYNFFKQSM